jgi:hypothetical protein
MGLPFLTKVSSQVAADATEGVSIVAANAKARKRIRISPETLKSMMNGAGLKLKMYYLD